MEQDNLYSLLNKFKKLTLSITKLIKEDNLDSIEGLFQERQNIIDSICKIECTTEEFKNISEKLNIKEEDVALKNLIEITMVNTKNEIQSTKSEILKLKNQRNINNKYINLGVSTPVFLSKKF